MKSIKQHIIEEIIRLKEAEFEAPEEIITALKDKLQMSPIERFVEKFKAVNSIPPSYRVFLHNGQFFDIVYEAFSLMVKIKGREYYIADLDERSEAVEEINRLLTINQMIPDEAGEGEEDEGDKLDKALDNIAPKTPPKPKGKSPAPEDDGKVKPPKDEPEEEPMV
jgi:hypothetical protein